MFLKDLSHPEFRKIEVTDFVSIGLSLDNHIVLEGTDIGARHARIEKRDDRYFVRDFKTASGTFLNGARILEGYINPGDLLKIGEYEFVFEKEEEKNWTEILHSHNERWRESLQRLPRFALSDLPVLILGPSGTGKEILSQWMHELSHRKFGPVMSVNCSALTESLAESELFGHTKGSFTGATQDRKGAFESAKGGTLILDEVGDLPLTLQPKLLRAIENKEIKPVGSDKNIRTNVRLVASTHQDLKKKVEAGEFRLDLFYRLNVIQLQVPPLSHRMEDFEKILFEFARDVKIKFLPQAIDALKTHNWPGNIRELKNFVYRAKAIYATEPIDAVMALNLIEAPMGVTVADEWGLTGKINVIREIEKKLIRQRLILNHGNQRRTAEDLGIPKSTLHDRMKSYDINVDGILNGSVKA